MIRVRECLSCGHDGLQPVLDLGDTPLANALLREEDLAGPEGRYPLKLIWCEACTLLQLRDLIVPEDLFRHYYYASSFSDAMLAHARKLVEELIPERELGPTSQVVELASNDGYLLQYYQARGIPALGVEPALNIAERARERGIETIAEFFGRELGERLGAEGRLADVIHAHNVLAHVPVPNDFVAGIAALLKPTGIAVIEVPYAHEMLERLEFDTIYHEHCMYFTLTALTALVERHGLRVLDVTHQPIHGGTLRVRLGKQGTPAPSVVALLAQEAGWGVDTALPYQRFAGRVAQLGIELRQLLQGLHDAGKRVAVYGASAKGATLLNSLGLGQPLLAYVVDRSTLKQGLYTPGTHLPIYPPERLSSDRPDYALLLTWNFAEEIMAQQQAYRDAGGRFIVPLPTPRIVE